MKEYKISNLIRKILICVCMIILAFSITGFISVAHAQPLVKPEWVMPDHYPRYFHGWGRLGYLDSKEIVVNDIAFKLSPYIEYHSPQRLNDSIYLFKPGKLVGFLFDEAGEIDTLWLIDMK